MITAPSGRESLGNKRTRQLPADQPDNAFIRLWLAAANQKWQPPPIRRLSGSGRLDCVMEFFVILAAIPATILRLIPIERPIELVTWKRFVARDGAKLSFAALGARPNVYHCCCTRLPDWLTCNLN